MEIDLSMLPDGDTERLKIRLESLNLKLNILESEKTALKEEADTIKIKVATLQIKAKNVEKLAAEILVEGTEILNQVRTLAQNGGLSEKRQELMEALEPLKKHFLSKKNS